MTRQEFCDLMAKAKEQSGIGTSDISFQMKMLLPALRRFELGKHNFNLQKAIQYLDILNAKLIISNNDIEICCSDYDQLINWLISVRQGRLSQRQLAEAISMSYVMIARIESKKSDITIDVLLKIIEVLGYELKIENN